LEDVRIGIVLSEWNNDITDRLLDGALSFLSDRIKEEDILTYRVPGSFELPLGAQWLLEEEDVDAVICIGCVIRGETAHFDFVSQACAQGVMEVGLKHSRPVIFCVLTDDNKEQSLARSGGVHGNKGVEAAVGAWKMIQVQRTLGSGDR
jgi:6,7-dimethyl-8-ribityllumazine synthase